MAGLRKQKKYDWKDSNMALFGSDQERKVKKASAMGEPAWEGAGQEVGLQIWRIVKFEVTHWPKEDYGKFYSGDSYIILNTYQPDPESEELAWDVHFWIGKYSSQSYHPGTSNLIAWDVHFWIGKYSSQDEYGTAAYKTVELDTFLDDGPVQHREVQGYESKLFKSYFENITVMEGGADTGFRHVEPEKYPPRLLHFKQEGRKVKVTEVQRTKKMLNSGDVFILDLGLNIYQWNGKKSSGQEKVNAQQFCQKLESERGGGGKAKAETCEEGDEPEEFWAQLPDEDLDADDETDEGSFPPTLLKVSDDSGKPVMTKVKEGGIAMSDFKDNDVFIFDTGKECFVYVGAGASESEKRNGLPYAHNHLQKTGHPCASVSVVSQDKKGKALDFFKEAVGAAA